MNARTWLNLGLLLLVVALGAFIANRPSDDDGRPPLTFLQAEQIDRIVIPRSRDDIVLEKTDGRWHMRSPYRLRAHEFRIDRLLDLATSPVEKTYDTRQLELADFGLDQPVARIRFNDTLLIYGDTNPVSKKRYVQVNDSLVLIDDELTPLIRSQPSSFADLSLLDDTQTLTRIELPEITLFRNANGLWQTDPASKGDADSVQALVEHWQSAQAFGVHAYMPRKQLGRIRLGLQDDSFIELEISDTTPWLILGRPDLGIEYHFDQSFNERLLQLGTTEAPTGNADA